LASEKHPAVALTRRKIIMAMADEQTPRQITAVLFDDFELLDVFGPLELFGVLPDKFRISLIGPTRGPVASAPGPQAVADHSYHDAPVADIVLVPGGIGTRQLVSDRAFLRCLAEWASRAELVASVCTGSGVLAAAGLLDGYRATSNKRAFEWAREQGTKVKWVPQARWVEDGDRWTSSGVAAGMDMAIALIARLHGEEVAATVANRVELEPHRDSTWDPFAAMNGLVPG
jgi:transcriptional regulator GlxA family with amidase domain